MVTENKNEPQLVIFPEGGTSNGLYLLNFKRGAFEPLLPIKPFFFEYYSPYCNPACDVIPVHLNLLFMTCQPFTTLVVHRMPTIYPTEYMYKNYGLSKENSKAEVYSNVARDIYSKIYNLQKVNNSQMDKVTLKKYLYSTETMNNDE